MLYTYPIDSMTRSCQWRSATTPALKLCRTLFFASFFHFLEFLRSGRPCPSKISRLAIVFCETPLPISFPLQGVAEAIYLYDFRNFSFNTVEVSCNF